MDGVTVVDHPLVQHKLTLMRDKTRSTKVFRELFNELGALLCYEATRDLPLKTVEVETPLAAMSSKVLDEWKFREQLPYGRGTTALFHGPSGCGKTMSALAVAKALGVGNGRKSGVPVLRIELSRLVSKYIGETPKNIDQVFADAKRSGAAILIDEADAALAPFTGKADILRATARFIAERRR